MVIEVLSAHLCKSGRRSRHCRQRDWGCYSPCSTMSNRNRRSQPRSCLCLHESSESDQRPLLDLISRDGQESAFSWCAFKQEMFYEPAFSQNVSVLRAARHCAKHHSSVTGDRHFDTENSSRKHPPCNVGGAATPRRHCVGLPHVARQARGKPPLSQEYENAHSALASPARPSRRLRRIFRPTARLMARDDFIANNKGSNGLSRCDMSRSVRACCKTPAWVPMNPRA